MNKKTVAFLTAKIAALSLATVVLAQERVVEAGACARCQVISGGYVCVNSNPGASACCCWWRRIPG